VSGGTENTRYFASGLVRHEGGTIYNTYADKQSVRLNLDQDIAGGSSWPWPPMWCIRPMTAA